MPNVPYFDLPAGLMAPLVKVGAVFGSGAIQPRRPGLVALLGRSIASVHARVAWGKKQNTGGDVTRLR